MLFEYTTKIYPMSQQNHGNESTNESRDLLDLKNSNWDEYKYRHQLCWELLFKITLVTTTLSILPYLNNDIIPAAKRLIFITPLIGIGVSAFGGYRLYRELLLLDKIRDLHRVIQNKLFNALYKETYQKDLFDLNGSQFTLNVSIYLIILNILAIVNFILLFFNFYYKCPS